MKRGFLAGVMILFVGHANAEKIILKHVFKDPAVHATFSKLVDDYNTKQNQDTIVLVASSDAIQNDGKDAHIMHRYDTEVGSMVANPGSFVPFSKLMKTYYSLYDSSAYLDPLQKQFLTCDEELAAFPFAATVGVMFYNKDAFKKAGLDVAKPPKQWEECEPLFKKLKAAGYSSFTTFYPVAYHIEHLCSVHNYPFATHNNGFDGQGEAPCCVFNSNLVKFHLGNIVRWQKEGFFVYKGHDHMEAIQSFLKGEIAMLGAGAILYDHLKTHASFEIGVAAIPYWNRFSFFPYRYDCGGGALWVSSGLSDEQYRAIASFFAYLSSPDLIARWSKATGYLPATQPACNVVACSAKEHPALAKALEQTVGRRGSDLTRGIRIDHYPAVRAIIAQWLDKIFAGQVSSEKGLDEAALAANKAIAEFSVSVNTP